MNIIVFSCLPFCSIAFLRPLSSFRLISPHHYFMQKPFSSLWLVELNKRVKENKIYQTAKRSDSHINLFGHILFSFILVIFVSSGLRLLEGALTKESGALSMNSALAAELSDKAALTFQSHSSIKIKPNEAITATLTFKNTGTTTWTQKS